MSTMALPDLIGELRANLIGNAAAFATPEVKTWCEQRWRFLFLDEAVKDKRALRLASRGFFDSRPPRQRIAEYFFIGADRDAWRDEQSAPDIPQIVNTTLIVCPGLLNGLMPMLREFRYELPYIERTFGMRTLHADSHPVRGCVANTEDLLRALNDGLGLDAHNKEISPEQAVPPRDVVLLCYSKGAADALTLLAGNRHIRPRIRAVVTWAGAIGGSELADEIFTRIDGDTLEGGALKLARAFKGMLPFGIRLGSYAGRRITEFDAAAALHDLTTSVRDRFLAEHGPAIDRRAIPFFTLAGSTQLRDVPFTQRKGFRTLSNFGEGNDMQLTTERATLRRPLASHLATLHAHHWDLAYPPFLGGRWFGINKVYHGFPKLAALKATLTLLAELGLAD